MSTKVSNCDDDRSSSASSSVGDGKKKKLDDDDEMIDLRYGCFGSRPARLQWLNTIVGFVVFLSFSNCFHSMALGLVGVVLSTLEKRFDFSSSSSSWIASAYEMGPIPVLIVISYFGNRIHRPLSCAVGLLMITLGCILFFLPQFTTPAYRPSNAGDGEDSNLCVASSNRTSGCSTADESLSGYLPVFIIARLLTGAGSTPIITLGLTYMDDCADRGKFAKYTGIFNAMGVIGPALAFVGGGLMLNIFVDFYVYDPAELGLTTSDSLWVGAWWLPYTITAALSLLNAIPMWGYPADLPGAAKIRESKVIETHNDKVGEPNPAAIAYIKSWSEFKELFKSVMTNPTYLCLTIFACCDNFIISAFTAFGPKVFEVGFTMTAAVAGALFGIVLLPAGAGGTIIGGILIEKLRLSCKQIIRIQAVLTAVVTAGICLLLLTCKPLDFAGVNTAYNTNMSTSSSSSDALNVTNACNVGCGCEHVTYDPVCGHDNIVYYSPCHAGCSLVWEDDDTKSYYNCSCIATPADSSSLEAKSDACSADFCPVAVAFMVIFFFAVAFIFICFTMNMAATLRCVSSSQTSFAIGMQVLFIKILGTIPGPLLMGVTFDSACVLWQYDECGAKGSCLFYDNEELALQLFIMNFSIKVISLVAMVLAAIIYKPPATVEPIVKDVLPVITHGHQLVGVSSTVPSNGGGGGAMVNYGGQVDDNMRTGYEDSKKGIPMSAAVVLTADETAYDSLEDHNVHL